MSAPGIMHGSKDVWKGVLVWAIKNAIFLLIYALLVLVVSGHPEWVMGWAFIGVMTAYIALTGIILYLINPSLLAERSGIQKGSKRWDIALAGLIALWLPLILVLVGALDKRYGWAPELPLWLQVAGLALTALGASIILWAMTVNSYFSAVVRIQEDRGHRVISTGPYRLIRHPGYASCFFYYPGAALALGSAWALVPAVLICILIVFRTSKEDETLQKELAGYKEYAARVRHRLIPGIW